MNQNNKELFNAILNYKTVLINVVNDKNSEINKKVKKIFVINLLEDTLKRNYIITLMKKYKLNYTLVIVDRVSTELHKTLCRKKSLISSSELGCCLSHLWCLNQIIKNKYENAIIFEDDIILHKNFTQLFLKIHNPNFNFLLLGAHDFRFSDINYKNVKNGLYRATKGEQLYGAHANYYSLRGAKRMFEIRVSEISFFDKEYMLMFDYYKESSYICYPNLCVSNVTDSTLEHKREILSDSEHYYYSKCFINFNFNNYNFIYVNLLSEILNTGDDYESYTDRYLYNYFHDINSINIVKKRLSTDFFTLNDLMKILNYNKNINSDSFSNDNNDSNSTSTSNNSSNLTVLK
jgi:GR25 family glycosyltransferase involved in LPS biosynthesis